jgi:hypothetical protein
MKKKLLVLFFKLKRFSLKKENGISSYLLSLWKKRKQEPQQHIPKSQLSELDRALSRYSHVLPTDLTSNKYNISIQEGFAKQTVGFTYTKKVLLKPMTLNQP